MDQIKADGDRAIAIGPFGSRMKADSYVASGVPVIRGNNLSDTRSFVGDFVFVSEETANELKSSNVFPGDLVFPHRGAIGQVGIVPDDGAPRYMLSTSLMKLTCNSALVDTRFVFYFFRSSFGRNALLERASTVGTPGIGQPLASLRSIQVPVPPIEKQRAIARTLGALDDKIELNRRMSETLEAMARALFKSWFVDFEPVRANAEGRDSRLRPSLARLFPDSLEASGPREIPKGWRVGKVGDLCEGIFSGGTPSTKNPEYWDGEIPWLSSGETRQSLVVETERRISRKGVENSSTRLAPAMSTVIASAGQGNTRGQTSLLAIESYVNQSVVVLKADSQVSSPLHLFFELERRYEEFRRVSDAHSSRGSLTTKLLANLGTVVPGGDVVTAFETLSGPLIERAVGCLREARVVESIRDTLLPKLLTGEIGVETAA